MCRILAWPAGEDPLGALGRPKTKGGTAASALARMFEQSLHAHRDCAEHHTHSEVVATQLLHDFSDEQSLQGKKLLDMLMQYIKPTI